MSVGATGKNLQKELLEKLQKELLNNLHHEFLENIQQQLLKQLHENFWVEFLKKLQSEDSQTQEEKILSEKF